MPYPPDPSSAKPLEGSPPTPTPPPKPPAKRGRAWAWWGATLLLVVLSGVGALRLETDNSPEVFFPQDSKSLAAYTDLLETFGSDRIVRLTLLGPGAWEAEGLAALDRLAHGARSLGGARVVDPRDWIASSGTSFRAAAQGGLPFHLGLVDANGKGISLAIELPTESLAARQAVLDGLEELVQAESAVANDFALHLSGLPVLDGALDRSSQEIMALYFPLLIVSATLLLALALRRRREVIAGLVYVGFCLLVTLGGMAWLGLTLNLVVAILPPVLFAIAMATAVHLLVRFRLRRGEGRSIEAAIELAVVEKRGAILWAGATTLVGFASLATAGPGPVRTLGITSAAGIVILTAASLTLLPALLQLLPVSRRNPRPSLNPFDRFFGSMGRRGAELATRHRRGLIVLLAVSGLVAAVGWSRLRIESNALSYLASDHPVRQSIEELERHGLGSGSLEVMLGVAPCEESERFDRSPGLEVLARASGDLRDLPSVLAVAGPAELAESGLVALRQRFGSIGRFSGPLDLETGLAAVAQVEAGGDSALSRFLTADGCRARLSLVVGLTGLEEYDQNLEAVRRVLREGPHGGFSGPPPVITGAYPLLLTTQRRLLSTFSTSALLSLLGIALLFFALTRHLGRTVTALLPNVWPVVMVIGCMGWFDIPLDIATVMVAAVILGLAVDDTVHTLAGFERFRAAGLSPRRAIVAVMEHSAPAYVLTCALLAAGFGVCAFSGFAPTARFGGLAALAMGFVLLGALFLLPALLGAASEAREE